MCPRILFQSVWWQSMWLPQQVRYIIINHRSSNAVKYRYNTTKYNIMLNTALHWPRWQIDHSLNRQKTTHVSPVMSLSMKTSWNGNTFCITGPLWGNPSVKRGFPSQRASDVEFWCFLWCQRLHKQPRGRGIEMFWWSFDVAVVL